MPAAAVVLGLSNQAYDHHTEVLADVPNDGCTFSCSSEKKPSMAALSPEEATQPIQPRNPLLLSSRTTFFDLNWLPRSERTIVSTGRCRVIAFRIGGAASADFIRYQMG